MNASIAEAKHYVELREQRFVGARHEREVREA